MRYEKSKPIVAFGENGETVVFESARDFARSFGYRNPDSVYGAIRKGCSARKDGVKWYVDYLFEGLE